MFKYLYHCNLFAFLLKCLIIPLYLYGFLNPFREVLISIFACVIVFNILRLYARSKHEGKMVIAANAYPSSVIVSSVFSIVALVVTSKMAMILSLCSSFIVAVLVIVALVAVKIYQDINKLNISNLLGLAFACISAFALSAIGSIFAFLNDLVFNFSNVIADSNKQKVPFFIAVLSLAISSLTINNTYLHISFLLFISLYALLVSISSVKRIIAVKSNMKVSDIHIYDYPELSGHEARNSFEFLLGHDLLSEIFIQEDNSNAHPMKKIVDYLDGLSDNEKDEIRILKEEEVKVLKNDKINEIYQSQVSNESLCLPVRDVGTTAHYCLKDIRNAILNGLKKVYWKNIETLNDIDIGFHKDNAEEIFKHKYPQSYKKKTEQYMKMCNRHKDRMAISILDRI